MTSWDPDQLLPARAIPLPGEAFGSWAARQQDLAGFNLSRWVPPAPTAPTALAQLAVLSRISGVDPETLQAMTWRDYPAVGISARRRQRWLVNAPWTCPVCQPRRTVWKKAWETGLCPCCIDCQVLLVDITQPPTDPQQAPPELLNLSHHLLKLLDHTTGPARLRRMHRLCVLVAATIDATWPPRPATQLLTDYTACRTWRFAPPRDPAATAEVLIAALSDTHPDYQRWLDIAGRARLTHAPAEQRPSRRQIPIRRRRQRAAWASKANPTASYPGIGYYVPPVTPTSPSGRQRFDALVEEAAATLTPNQVPGLMPQPGDAFLPPPDHWGHRHDLALAVDMLLHTDDRGRPGLLGDAHAHFGEPDSAPSLLLRDLTRRQISPDTEQELRTALPLLTAMPDLAGIRTALRQHFPLPLHWSRHLPPGTDPALSRGWIWCYLTRGDLRAAPPHARPVGLFPSRAVWDFHHSLPTHTLLEMTLMADALFTPTLLEPNSLKPATGSMSAMLEALA